MSYTITIENINYKQLHELTNKLATFGRGLAASGIGEDGKEWRIKVATGAFYTKQVFNALTAVLAQSVTIPYYTIDELPEDVQRRLIQHAIYSNIYWDDWQSDREKSFDTICTNLAFLWGKYSNGSIFADIKSGYSYANDIKGARRVIAYINNRWDFKTAAYTDNSKLKALRKKWTLAKSHTEDNLPTGYCADYCCMEAYIDFLKLARKNPDTVTLADFCKLLAHHFNAEEDRDYEQATSDEYVKKNMLANHYYTWYGEDITDLVTRK